jgi:hypothetical protein
MRIGGRRSDWPRFVPLGVGCNGRGYPYHESSLVINEVELNKRG